MTHISVNPFFEQKPGVLQAIGKITFGIFIIVSKL